MPVLLRGRWSSVTLGKIIVDVHFMVPIKAAFVLRNEY